MVDEDAVVVVVGVIVVVKGAIVVLETCVVVCGAGGLVGAGDSLFGKGDGLDDATGDSMIIVGDIGGGPDPSKISIYNHSNHTRWRCIGSR